MTAPVSRDPAIVVAEALEPGQRERILARWNTANPHQRGAEVPDILDMLAQADSDLDVIEPFIELNPGIVHDAVCTCAILAIIWSRPGDAPRAAVTIEAYQALVRKTIDPSKPIVLNMSDYPAGPELPDLEEPCGPCQGVGIVEEPEWAAWWKRYKTARDAWEAAHPHGRWYDSPEEKALDDVRPRTPAEEIDCPACHGTGKTPTAAGQAILSFLVNHWRR